MPNTSKGNDKQRNKKPAKKDIRIPDGPPEWIEGPQFPPEIMKKIEEQVKKKGKNQ